MLALLLSLHMVITINICTGVEVSSPSPVPHFPRHTGRNSSLNTVLNAEGFGLDNHMLKDCIDFGSVPNPLKGHLYTFTSAGLSQCWMYCKFLFKCWDIIFDTLSSTCSMFDINAVIFVRQSSANLTVSKRCMESGAPIGSNFSETLSLSQSDSPGFLIRNAVAIISCLNKRGMPENETVTLRDVSYGLTWRSCNKANRWMLREVESEEFYFHISPVGEPDLCLDVRMFIPTRENMYENLTQAFVAKCGNYSSQMMTIPPSLMVSYDDSTVKYSIYSISELQDSGYFSILFTGEDVCDCESLTDIAFINPKFYPPSDNQICSISQFATRHGTVRNKENLPFFLPGQKVEVFCNQGYGVKSLNFTSLQVVVCNKRARPLPCTRIAPSRLKRETEGGREKSRYLILMVAIVSSISVVVLIAALMVRKRPREGSENVAESKNTLETA